VIVAGFQGVSETKEITTLGRGGSDTTAVALAVALRAEKCEIYTDVDGVYSADPRIVKQAKFWKKIPHDLMVEMATRGAGVLHPRSVELAKQFNVPLCVKNSLNEHEGTTVISRESKQQNQGMEDFQVTGVTADSSRFLIHVTLARPTALSSLWDRAAQAHLPILTPNFADGEVRFFSDRDGEMEWRKHFEELVKDGFVKKYEVLSEIVPLSVVGDRFSQDGSALQQVVETLARHDIHVTLGVASSLAITVAVPKSRAVESVQALHAEFLEGSSLK
jgi:aspartate kinase